MWIVHGKQDSIHEFTLSRKERIKLHHDYRRNHRHRFSATTRIVGCEKTKRAICIDPGDGSDEIVQAIDQNGLNCRRSSARMRTWITSAESALKKLNRS